MTRSLVLAVLILGLLPSPAAGGHAGIEHATTSRPNVLVVIIDDAPAGATGLWEDPARTPAIARHLVERGVTFADAFGSSPLCCPGRVNILTGLVSHQSGVVTNDVTPLDPSVTVGTELQAEGYHTLYAGKYLNGLGTVAQTEDAVDRYAAGWDEFDVIWADNGKFHDYSLWTRSGVITYGRQAADHSVDVTSRRLAAHLRAAPLDKPVFAVLSLYAIHAPDPTMPRFEGDVRCADMPDHAPPNYNEADVSDKPAYVQGLAPLVRPAWPMRENCEGMLGVDLAVSRVRAALGAQGRLQDTLIVFVADNGMNFGSHRLAGKSTPYATPVPLYMAWPARWGTDPRRIEDYVANVDIAPTLCAVAGCLMGPFPTGQDGPDGVSLLPLLDGDVSQLDRDVIYDELLASDQLIGRPAWTAVRTTPQHPLGAWHYVRYDGGETELYDTRTDPWELRNRSGRPSVRRVEEELARLLSTRMRRDGVTFLRYRDVRVGDDRDIQPRRRARR